MANFLTSDAKFICGQMIQFSCLPQPPHTFLNNSPVLTDKAKINPLQPLCPFLTARNQGVATPCTQTNKNSWQLVDPKHKINHESMLTSQSFQICTETGCKISFLLDGSNIGKFAQGLPVMAENPPAAKSGEEKADAQTNEDREEAGTGKNSGVDAAAPAKVADAKETGPHEKANAPDEEEEEKAAYLCASCAASQCEYRDKYRQKTPDWEGAPTNVDNSSKDLKKNFFNDNQKCPYSRKEGSSLPLKTLAFLCSRCEAKKCEREKDKISDEDSDWKEMPWKQAAHHIISGNQVFKKFPDVVRMAHLCGYDINNAKNCYIMPTWEDNYGSNAPDLKALKNALSEKERERVSKETSAYDAMSKLKLQWHLGGHQYLSQIASRDNVDEIRKTVESRTGLPARSLKDYMQLLLEEMAEINGTLDRTRICPKIFNLRMDALCERVRAKLDAFSTGYHKSFPYYVSQAAFLFTFELPVTFLVMAVRRKENCLYLEKYRVSRKKDGMITANGGASRENGALEYSLSPDDNEKRSCVNFCANVEHFVFFGKCGKDALPFAIDDRHLRKVASGSLPFAEYAHDSASGLMIWLRDTAGAYVSPSVKISQRLRELSSGAKS